MEITKNKYKRAEVVEIIESVKCEYEAKLKEQKSRILDLTKENSQLISDLDKCKDKEKTINQTMLRAEKNAEKLKEKTELQYALEMERLRIFKERWERYFTYLKEKYPIYAPVDQAIDVYERLNAVLKLSDSKKSINKLEKTLAENNADVFNPKLTNI